MTQDTTADRARFDAEMFDRLTAELRRFATTLGGLNPKQLTSAQVAKIFDTVKVIIRQEADSRDEMKTTIRIFESAWQETLAEMEKTKSMAEDAIRQFEQLKALQKT